MRDTALVKFLVGFFSFLSFFLLYEKAEAVTVSEGVGVAAEVVLLSEQEAAIKSISGIIASPSPARVGYVIEIVVTLKGYDGMLLPFHSVRIEADGPGIFDITQPAGLTGYDGISTAYITSDVAGIYTVYAYDTTYSEKDIKINDDADAIFIAEGIPILYSEPEFTQGYSNSLDWEPLPNIVAYYLEGSSDPTFKNVVFSSGWITDTEYEFNGLQDSIKYYYRVKGRNAAGANTLWSNIVFSTQDATPPVSQVTNVDKHPSGFRVYIDAEDSLGDIEMIDIYAKLDKGKWVLVKTTELDSVLVEFTDIENFDLQNKPERICFYSRAEDTVGNLEVVDPGETGDFCVGYGFTLQNIIDLVVDESEKVMLSLKDLFDSGVEYVTQIVENNLLLFQILVFVLLLIYILFVMYEKKIKFGEIGLWLDLLNLKFFPWIIPDEEKIKIGVVFDSFTHEPLRNVLVKLMYKEDVVQISITDDFGVFKFVPDDRKCTIVCWKAGYVFPARDYKVKDEVYSVIYTGDVFVVDEDREKLIGVPIDFVERSSNLKFVFEALDFFVDIFRLISPFVLVFGIVISLILNSISPAFIYYVLSVLYLIFLANKFGVMTDKKLRWGIVRDDNGDKISGVKIGLYDRKFSKLLDFRVSDELGRYRFVVPSGRYTVKILNPEYKLFGKGNEIDFLKGRAIEISANILVDRR